MNKIKKLINKIIDFIRGNKETEYIIGIDIAPGKDITPPNNYCFKVHNKNKKLIEVDRLFHIMHRTKKHRVKKKLAKRIMRIYRGGGVISWKA